MLGKTCACAIMAGAIQQASSRKPIGAMGRTLKKKKKMYRALKEMETLDRDDLFVLDTRNTSCHRNKLKKTGAWNDLEKMVSSALRWFVS